ncbi:response regulator [Fluviispira multicolorata]|uniref:Response regulator n=1 Tax=Fluviispira multicolorata TaxID=2654512 RepID=A0A833N470_9BACT|nr:response regulator [Fluviispira multicolorata]KAB8029971.1 response regulator [Fluviispira multicolorata]
MAKTILIVDDAITVRNLAKYALSRGGYNILEAEDGSVGLAVTRSNNVDLIISDLNMPKMNGLELAKAIKSDPKTQNIPIFMLSTVASQEVAQQGKEIGIMVWIVKPFVPDKLLAAVKRVLD